MPSLCSVAAVCSTQTAGAASRLSGRLSQGGYIWYPGFGSSSAYRRDGWAGRCGLMLPILILTATLWRFGFRRPARRPSFCAQLSSCGSAVWIGHAPLWQMWFLTGLPDRRLALFVRMHHAIADGLAGVATVAKFLDATPDAAPTSPQAWIPARVSTER